MFLAYIAIAVLDLHTNAFNRSQQKEKVQKICLEASSPLTWLQIDWDIQTSQKCKN